MPVEKQESNENRLGWIDRKLESLKNRIKNERSVDKPGQVTFLRESNDKKYNIYGYKLVQGGTKGGIKDKYIQQIGPRVNGTQFSDIYGNELKKDRFGANEVVYLRVPKQGTSRERQNNVETKNMPKGLTLDHGTYIYTVQKGDNESAIKQKLSKYTPLSYLKNISSGITGWNFSTIPDNKLSPGLKIPVPKKDSERIKTITSFKASQKSALNEMKGNAAYGSKIQKLLKKYSENHIANVMTAYAMCESSPENASRVGEYALFRYEQNHHCASYGYHHVLREGIGKKAFDNTGLSIGQSCNPKDSGKLFLAFCIEKAEGAMYQENKDFTKFFDMRNTQRCAKFYNGSTEYATKLKNNFNKVKDS